MEQNQQQEDIGVQASATEAKNSHSNRSPVRAKRSGRMLYESSFATSFTSARGQKRPPGFVASSLDYKSTGVNAASSPSLTTKPGRNSLHNKQKKQKEQLEVEQQQLRQYRSGQSQPTRAQGNFGPPPHSITTIEDLESMSEEQIYKLFMEDPELYESFIKSTETERGSTPTGARKARRSTSKKPSSESKSKRRSAKAKTIKSESQDREIPYFQWIFLLVLVGVAIYQGYKTYSSSTSTKDKNNSIVSRRIKGGKQKNKKGGKSDKKVRVKTKEVSQRRSEASSLMEKKHDVETANTAGRPSSSKKKKKMSKSKSKAKTNTFTGDSKEEEQNKPDLDSSDVSSEDQALETSSKLDSTAPSNPSTIPNREEDNDGEWQTVTKSSKGSKKEKALPPQNFHEDKEVIAIPVVESKQDNPSEKAKDDPESPEERNTFEDSDFIEVKSKKKKRRNLSNSGKEKTNNAQSAMSVETTSIEKPSVTKNENLSEEKQNGESVASTEEDAALALKLHEEMNLSSKTDMSNSQEEGWEEVTSKKKKA
ncbi:unnamed protein product [Pseudo-nitzschia multistriata]|uniref:Uncharacterized protein n=1 Tax=Pseudo-nitzschia multistriata TaxID=183589 RepID=A0A448ZG27_9STRA|nr:unnamed protein product [Pseudo-nitzschia multistriata]